MLNANAARNVVGIIGNVISFALFVSPVPTFYRIWRNKAVEDFSPIPYIATVLNCMMWIFYGIPFVHPHSILVVTINGTGLTLEIIYLSIYLYYATKKQRLFVLCLLSLEVALMVVLVPVVLTQLHTHEERSMIVGILCVIFGVCMYVSPLSIMKMVIKTKSVKYMPFYLSLAAFLNGACWTAYALIRFDLYITISNGLGTISGVAQLILYGCYYRTTVWDDDKKKLEADLQLPTTTVAHKS